MLFNSPGLPAGSRHVGAAERADISVAKRLADKRHHPAMRAAGGISELGDQPPLAALSGGVLAWGLLSGNGRVAAAGGRMLASLVLATVIKGGLKRLVSRTRPNVLLDEGHYEVRPLGPNEGPWHSFPSGHTAGSVATARALARTLPRARVPAYAAAAAVALVQIPRGAHYPSDIVAGLLVGLAAEALVDRFVTVSLEELDAGQDSRMETGMRV